MVFKSERMFLFRIARWFFMEKGKVFENRSGTYMEKVHIFVMKNQSVCEEKCFFKKNHIFYRKIIFMEKSVFSFREK